MSAGTNGLAAVSAARFSASEALAEASGDPDQIAAARAERRKVKKDKKRALDGKLAVAAPTVSMKDVHAYYGDARAEFAPIPDQKQPRNASVTEVQQLLMYLYDAAPAPKWIMIKNKPLISNVLLLFVRGYGYLQFGRDKLSDPSLLSLRLCKRSRLMPCKMERGLWNATTHEVRSADSTMLYERSSGKCHAGLQVQGSCVPCISGEELCSRLKQLVMRLDEMRSHGFPLPELATGKLPDGFTCTRTAHEDMAESSSKCCEEHWSGSAQGVRLLAVDCEMCLTAAGLQLARVSILNGDGVTLFDALVKPELPVLDYLTQYSGITASMLATAELSLDEARSRVIHLLDGTDDGFECTHQCILPAYLVGHSIESDLQALKLVHTRIIDTSVIYLHPSGLPYRHSLRHLAKVHLQRDIQLSHGSDGHDSTEDALAALHLVTRLLHGDDVISGVLGGEEEAEPPPSKRPRTDKAHESVSPVARRIPLRVSNTFVFHDTRQMLQERGRSSWTRTELSIANAPSPAPSLGALVQQMKAEPDSQLPGISTQVPQEKAVAETACSMPRPSRNPPRRRNILNNAAFKESASCTGVSVIGSASFVRDHALGAANGIHAPGGVVGPDASFVLKAACKELNRFAAIRSDGRSAGLGLVIAECAFTPASFVALEHHLGGCASTFPTGTALLCVCQDRLNQAIDVELVKSVMDKEPDMLSAANPAAMGLAIFTVFNSARASTDAAVDTDKS